MNYEMMNKMELIGVLSFFFFYLKLKLHIYFYIEDNTNYIYKEVLLYA